VPVARTPHPIRERPACSRGVNVELEVEACRGDVMASQMALRRDPDVDLVQCVVTFAFEPLPDVIVDGLVEEDDPP